MVKGKRQRGPRKDMARDAHGRYSGKVLLSGKDSESSAPPAPAKPLPPDWVEEAVSIMGRPIWRRLVDCFRR